MSLTIYGSPRSRTMRVLWMAEELDLSYEHVPYEFDDPALKQPAFLELNRAGAIPTIVDDGFALSESLAINLYLAKKYGSSPPAPLYPPGAKNEATTMQWSLWAQGHIEPWVQKDLLLTDLIDAIGLRADEMVRQSLGTLDRALNRGGWLVGEHFSVCDINVGGVLSPSRSRSLDLSQFAGVSRWLERVRARPAWVAVYKRFFG